MNKQIIIVAFGGASPEHEVSVLTAMQAMSALEESTYKTVPLYISKSGIWYTGDILRDLKNYEHLQKLTHKANQCSFAQQSDGKPILRSTRTGFFSSPEEIPIYTVLTAFHGSNGENGAFQGVCETFNIPYTGSGVMASSVGMDKVTTKKICRAEHIPVVDGVDFFETDWVDDQETIIKNIEEMAYPVVIKPVHLGSSIGVEVVKSKDDLIRAIETGFRYDAQILVEKAVAPLTEINCSVLGSPQSCEVSVCERPVGIKEILSFEDKYQRENSSGKGMASADRVIPADIDKELAEKIRGTAKKVFKTLHASGLARLDFLVHAETNEYYFNEINTIPGSFSFYLWRESGLQFNELLIKLIEIAIEQHQQKNGRIQSYETNLLSQKAVKGMKGLKGSK